METPRMRGGLKLKMKIIVYLPFFIDTYKICLQVVLCKKPITKILVSWQASLGKECNEGITLKSGQGMSSQAHE